ncbi:proline porter II [Bordetella hinzii 5132]|nr:proline porter II [Bordetella hinzii 5132]
MVRFRRLRLRGLCAGQGVFPRRGAGGADHRRAGHVFRAFSRAAAGRRVLRRDGRPLWPAESALPDHHHHGDQHVLHRADPLLRGHRPVGAAVAIAVQTRARVFGGREYTGAAVFVAEYAPDRRRGFLGSWLDFGSIAGFVLGAGLVVLLQSLLGDEAFLDWGWRLPFFVAGPLGLLGLYLRHAAEETPAFTQQLEKMEQEDRDALQDKPTISFREIFSKYRRALLICIGMVLVTNITYYMLLTYMPTYLSGSLGYSESHGVLIIVVVMIGMLFVQPVVGFMSDKVGRRPFLLAGSLGVLLLAVPSFGLIGSDNMGLIFLGLLFLAVLLNCMTGVMASTLPALFPTRIRYSALASSFNVAIIVAGLTPTLSAWLVEATDNLMMPAFYLMAAAVIGLVTAFFLPETANKPLRGDTPNASSRHEAKALLLEAYDNIEQALLDVEAEIAELEARIAALREKRQRLADRHPHLE